MIPVVSPFPQYFDLDGSPLDAGSIFYGAPSENPETSPVVVYWDAAGTQPAAQPIRTLNGYPVRNGSPAQVFAPVDYSYSVKNRRGMLVLYMPGSTTQSNLINVRVFDLAGPFSGEFSAGTTSIVYEIFGAGAGSGGCPITSGSQQAYSAGAGGGAYTKGRAIVTSSPFSGVVGAPGAAGSPGGDGGDGGASSFISDGISATAPGGIRSVAAIANSGIGSVPLAAGGAIGTGGNIMAFAGGSSLVTVSAGLGFLSSNIGGPSGLGNSKGYGVGAPGKYAGVSTAAPQPGIAAVGGGAVILWEYRT